MALTKVTSGGIKDGTITNDDIKSDAAITAGKLSATLDLSSKTITLPSASVTAHATTPTLDSPSITGTLFVDDGSTVSHTISNWSDDITYTITPTNCTVGSVNSSGVFVVTHTSGTPSYTIKATTDSLGLADSSVVTKNIGFNLSAPTISSPADVDTATDVVYTITSTDSNDDKIILDIGSSNFTYSSVSVGTASKVGNTVECIGFTTNNPAVTIQFTAAATYSVTAKSVNIAGTYGDSALSSADSITITTSYSIDYLVVAGGGGGGHGLGAGGGAGGYRASWNSETSGGGASSQSSVNTYPGVTYTVNVGAGGNKAPNYNVAGSSGATSYISGSGITTISCVGGGGGGSNDSVSGTNGGSGGGLKRDIGSPGSGTAGEGYAGGTGETIVGYYPAGGGGGAGAVGGDNNGSTQAGNGGNGVITTIITTSQATTNSVGHVVGANVYFAGGGGGSGRGTLLGGSGGNGGGASGSDGNNCSTLAQGTNYSGGGGGGGSSPSSCSDQPGSDGGDGIVILRMPTSDYSGTTSGAPTLVTSGSDTILIFKGDGSYTS